MNFRLRMRGTPVVVPPDPDPEYAPGGIAELNAMFKPVGQNLTLYRTMLVDAGDEVIDLSREWMHPGSPQAVLFQVSGADAANWKQDTVGLLTAVVANRTAMKNTTQTLTVKALNGNGWSDEYTLIVKVVADADARFADFNNGADSGNGQTPATAWKRVPGAAGYTGSAVTLGAGKVLFLKAGEHRYNMASNAAQNYTTLGHGGTTGNPMVYSLSGWGQGGAKLWGDVVEAGTVSTVTQAEVGGNPDYASIRKITLATAIQPYQRFFAGDRMLNPAQNPAPLNPRLFSGAQDAGSNSGMYTGIAMTSSADTTPRAYQTGGAGGTITWKDDRHAARYGNVASNTVEGAKVQFWSNGNFIGVGTVTAYTYATSTITLTPDTSVSLYDAGTGFTSLGVMFHPRDISGDGQYAVSADGLTVYFRDDAAATERSVSRLTFGWALGTSYVKVVGGTVARFAGPNTGAPGSGSAFIRVVSSDTFECDVQGVRIEHCVVYNGGGVISNANTAGTWQNSNIIGNSIGFCPYSGFFRNGAAFDADVGSTSLTKAQVAALPYGKVRANYIEPYALQGTSYLFGRSRNLEISHNVHRASRNTHGGGLKMYTDNVGLGDRIDHNYVHHNLWADMDRCMAFSGTATDRSNWLEWNAYIGDPTGANFAVARDPGCERLAEVMCWSEGKGSIYPYVYMQAAGDYGDQFRGCVVAGAGRGTLANCKYDIQDCLWIDDSTLENDGVDRVFTNNTSDLALKEWDWVNDALPAAWEAHIYTKCGAGRLGPYWDVAA